LSLGVIQFYILSIRLNQLNHYLHKSTHNFNWKHYYRYRNDIANILLYFSEYNHLFGRIFTAFLLANYPTNAFIMIILLIGRFELTLAKIYLISDAVFPLICLVGMHLYFGRFSQRWLQSSGVLLKLMASTQYKIGDLRTRIRLSLSIGAIHTKNV